MKIVQKERPLMTYHLLIYKLTGWRDLVSDKCYTSV